MSRSPFQPGFADLPARLPLFPLPGALLLPGGTLPLNIFEPRYLAMVFDALGEGRMIGMIQPRRPEPDPVSDGAALHAVGCAGRISTFRETNDGRLLITLEGVCRFRLGGEVAGGNGYRRAEVDFRAFRADMEGSSPPPGDRAALLKALGPYLQTRHVDADWDVLNGMGDEELVTVLSMGLPFGPDDKQGLLEAAAGAERCRILAALLEMAALEPDGTEDTGGVRH